MNKDTKIIKFLCVAVMIISLFIYYGLAGGLEWQTVGDMFFIKWSLISTAGLGLSMLVMEWMEKIEWGRMNGSRKKLRE